MDSTAVLYRLIDALKRLALMAHPKEYQVLRRTAARSIFQPWPDRKWNGSQYQVDQDRFLPWAAGAEAVTTPDCADQMEDLLFKSAALALDGAVDIASSTAPRVAAEMDTRRFHTIRGQPVFLRLLTKTMFGRTTIAVAVMTSLLERGR